MIRIRMLLGLAWVLLLGGCMMSPVGYHGGLYDGRARGGRPGPLQQAEAREGDLTIGLSFPRPVGGAPTPIDVRLGTDDDPPDPADADVRLRVVKPDGGVDQLAMRHTGDPAAATEYRAPYTFRTPGIYALTAEARVGAGAKARTVSVTTRSEVVPWTYDGHWDWLTPAALLGGLGMLAMMAVM